MEIEFNLDDLPGMADLAEEALIQGGQEIYCRGKKLVMLPLSCCGVRASGGYCPLMAF
jgi:hypothetical protein